MKTLYTILIIFLLPFCTLTMADQETKLSGIVNALTINEDHLPTRVALLVLYETPNGEYSHKNYFIENEGKGKELLAHVGENIFVSGRLKKRIGNGESIVVSNYVIQIDDETIDDEFLINTIK